MSTVQEIKVAAERLAPEERLELARWLAESDDVKKLRLAELRQEIAVGLAQADRGELTDSKEVFGRRRHCSS